MKDPWNRSDGGAVWRRDVRPAARDHVAATVTSALARLHTAAGPVLAVLAPYARRLKPLYPRPGRT
ncbi:hypothetical protein ABZ471_44460, partial [Streptomyces sp. NPDC005728]|uniref:hypothetical protein n=1 Tax=Streptomyces sp. NPDC005728 TaxID=3157054 RepID=UPI00340BD007